MKKDFIFLCLGDSSVLFDSFGALVADKLRERNFPYYVFGGVKNPITTSKVKMYVEQIKKEFLGYEIVIVDCTPALQKLNNSVDYLSQEINVQKGKCLINNINFECGDYNILCQTFYMQNNKIYSININDILTLSSIACDKILQFFNV